jgi:hypothetical protein
VSKLAGIRQLDTSSPEALKRDLGRLIETLDREFDAIVAARFFEWNEVTPLQRGTVQAKFGQLVRMDTTPGRAAPHVQLPEATTADIGKSVGVSRNNLSPTGLVVFHPAGSQLLNYSSGAATLVASSLGIRVATWLGSSWEVRF